MSDSAAPTVDYMTRLLLEDVCSDLVCCLHAQDDTDGLGDLHIDREWALGSLDRFADFQAEHSFADLRVKPKNHPAYFLEVKYGYSASRVLSHLQRKYQVLNGRDTEADRLILVIDTASHPDWPQLETAI